MEQRNVTVGNIQLNFAYASIIVFYKYIYILIYINMY